MKWQLRFVSGRVTFFRRIVMSWGYWVPLSLEVTMFYGGEPWKQFPNFRWCLEICMSKLGGWSLVVKECGDNLLRILLIRRHVYWIASEWRIEIFFWMLGCSKLRKDVGLLKNKIDEAANNEWTLCVQPITVTYLICNMMMIFLFYMLGF